MTKVQLMGTIFLTLVLLTTCLTKADDDGYGESVDARFKKLLVQLNALEIEAAPANKNKINNNNNAHLGKRKIFKKQSNQIGCYPLNFYNSNSFSKNAYLFTNNVYREIFAKKQQQQQTTFSINIEKFQLLAPEPYWSRQQIKRFHRVVMILKEEISQLKNPDNILKVKKTIASLLDLPIKEDRVTEKRASKKKAGGDPICMKVGRVDTETNTKHLCEQCLNDKRLTSDM